MNQAWKNKRSIQIGQNIRERRKALGLTQAHLAKGLFSVQAISLIERGKLNVSAETLEVFAERLNCPVQELLQMNELREDWLEDLLKTALRHQESNRLNEAMEVLHTLYAEALVKNNTRYLQESSYLLCTLYHAVSKYSTSTDWGQEALRLLDPEPHLDRVINTYITVSRNYYMVGNMWEAFDLLRKAEQLVTTPTATKEAGNLYFGMALIKQMLQNWEGCIWYSEQALQQFEHRDEIIKIGRTLMMMGTAYKNQGRITQARQQIERSIRILSQTNDLRSLARSYHNLGEVELKISSFDKARKHFLRALKLKRQSGDKASILNTLHALAKVEIHYGEFEKARRILQECLTRAEQMNNPLQLAITKRHFGDLALQQNQEEVFIHFYKQAIESFEKLKFSTELAEAAEKLGDHYIQKGRDRQAIHYVRLANQHYRRLLKKS
ncbi:tetratricopeptide repeat protein [Tumebacillus lipolyticus]|uniref:Tetratricopeptide repeat protein n=1 Tax=Tumebacillus lipolyticus TaxID=1280370 RepID=A0ABW4ZS71_9BACL